jgi:ABC-type glycerol-3-phosphate transport system permease component
MAQEGEISMRILPRKSLLFVLMLFVSFLSMYPLVWVLLQSFKTEAEFLMNIWTLPSAIRLNGYRLILIENSLLMYFKNSFIVMITTTLYDLILITMAGYAFAKLRFPFKTVLFYYIVLNMFIPSHIILLPMFMQVIRLRMINTLPALILPYFQGFAPMGLFLCRNYFSDIPDELMEAAKLDGCGPFSIFLRIMLPLAKPIIATIAILASMGVWNEYLWAMISLTEKSRYTVSIGMATLSNMTTTIGFIPIFSGLTLSALVIIIVFLSLQRNFIDSIASGAVKG